MGKTKENGSIIKNIRRVVIIALFAAVIVLIRPCIAKAEATMGAFKITDGESNCSYNTSLELLTISGDCTVANTDPDTATHDHIKITNGCTVTLAGVNIDASSWTPPISINISDGDTVMKP